MIRSFHRVLLVAAAAVFGFGILAPTGQSFVYAQDEGAGATDTAEPKDGKEKEEVEVDPFAVPETEDAAELVDFISSVKRLRGRTLESALKSAGAVVDAATAARQLDDIDLATELKVAKEQMDALVFLARFDAMNKAPRDATAELKELTESLLNDPRPEMAAMGKAQAFQIKIDGASDLGEKDQMALIDELAGMVSGKPFDRQAYGLANSLARSISSSDTPQVAAGLYERMAEWMAGSDDEQLQSRAEKMIGAARRMRLPGNFMELVGQTTTGEPFDWAAYRGKVVLVDFWASWCGPCRGEIPNMKRNLEVYGDRGFAIVGINLDKTLEACNEYVAEEELSWENLISDQEGEMGWDNPLANYYGISGIPTAILVDQEGKVISMSARGKTLDKLLAETLGPVEEESAKEDSDEPGPPSRVSTGGVAGPVEDK